MTLRVEPDQHSGAPSTRSRLARAIPKNIKLNASYFFEGLRNTLALGQKEFASYETQGRKLFSETGHASNFGVQLFRLSLERKLPPGYGYGP